MNFERSSTGSMYQPRIQKLDARLVFYLVHLMAPALLLGDLAWAWLSGYFFRREWQEPRVACRRGCRLVDCRSRCTEHVS